MSRHAHPGAERAHRITTTRGKHRPERVEWRRIARLVFADLAPRRAVTA